MIHRFLSFLNHTKNDKKLFGLVLVTSAVAAGVISLLIGMSQSVWFDEAYSVMVAKQPLGEVIRLVALDTHPPLYYVVLHLWGGVFGWSELALRMLSVMGLSMSVVVAGLFVRRLFGARVAIGVLLLLPISPLLLRYGFEIRMYSLASLIGITATYLLYVSWKTEGKKRLRYMVAYTVLIATGMLTLYYLAFLWIAHVVWLTYVHNRHHRSKRLIQYLIAYVAAGVLFLPWAPTLLDQMTNGALAPIGQPLTLENIIGIGTFNVLYEPLYKINILLTFVALGFIASLIWAVRQAHEKLTHYREEISLLVAYIAVPVILLMIISLARPMYVERYLAHVAIGLILLFGVVIITAAIQSRTKLAASVGLAIVYGAFLIGTFQLAEAGNYNYQRLQHPAVNTVAQEISTIDTSSLILAADPYTAIELDYYISDRDVYFVSPWATLGGGYAPLSGSSLQVRDVTHLQNEGITYIYYNNPEYKLPSVYKPKIVHAYGGLTIAQYERSH